MENKMEENQSSLIMEQTGSQNQAAINTPKADKLCENCNSKKAIYRCPRCLFESCSVVCVKEHKREKNCSEFSNQESGSPEDILLKDYLFLEDIKLKLDKSLQNPQNHFLHNHPSFSVKPMKSPAERNPTADYTNKLPPKLRHRGGLAVPNYPDFIPSIGVLMYRKDIPVILQRLRQRIFKRGTKLSFMPRNMTRRKLNTTHYSQEDKSIKWHVALRFIHANVVFEKTVDEDLTIADILSEYFENNPEDFLAEYLEKSKDEKKILSDISIDEENQTDSNTPISYLKDIKGYTTTFNNYCVPKVALANAKKEVPLVVDITPQYGTTSHRKLDAEQVREMSLYQSAGLAGISVVLLNEDFENNRKYIAFDLEDTLRENLCNLRIVEYPILIIMRKSHVYEFMGEETLKEQAIETNEQQKKKKKNKSFKYFDASSDDEMNN